MDGKTRCPRYPIFVGIEFYFVLLGNVDDVETTTTKTKKTTMKTTMETTATTIEVG